MIKKVFVLLFFCLTFSYSQSPEKFTYQSVIKSSSGYHLKNWDEKEIDLNVFDMMGKNVLFTNISADKTKLDLSYLSSGAYIISLGYSCGSINSFKLLINKK